MLNRNIHGLEKKLKLMLTIDQLNKKLILLAGQRVIE